MFGILSHVYTTKFQFEITVWCACIRVAPFLRHISLINMQRKLVVIVTRLCVTSQMLFQFGGTKMKIMKRLENSTQCYSMLRIVILGVLTLDMFHRFRATLVCMWVCVGLLLIVVVCVGVYPLFKSVEEKQFENSITD